MRAMEKTGPITLTNMCMVYDNYGNVLVEEKVGNGFKGLVFPGGHVEKHEAITGSVIREVREGTGLTISNLQICGVKDWIEDDGPRYMVFLYKTNHDSGELQSSSEGKVFWMPLDKLRAVKPMWHMDKMLGVFCNNSFSGLYFDKNGKEYAPELK